MSKREPYFTPKTCKTIKQTYLCHRVDIFPLDREDIRIYGDDIAVAGFAIELQRYSKSFILRYYVPLAAMVIVSWISFIAPPDVIPGRTALLVTIFLVLTAIFGNIQVRIDHLQLNDIYGVKF